jgi:hypothetical protein
MKSEKEIQNKIDELTRTIGNEFDPFASCNLVIQRATLKWVLK